MSFRLSDCFCEHEGMKVRDFNNDLVKDTRGRLPSLWVNYCNVV